MSTALPFGECFGSISHACFPKNSPSSFTKNNHLMHDYFSFRADKMYDMLKDQAELLKELNQLTRVEGVSSRDGKNGEEKKQKSGLFGF